jgi:hypothetical protein
MRSANKHLHEKTSARACSALCRCSPPRYRDVLVVRSSEAVAPHVYKLLRARHETLQEWACEGPGGAIMGSFAWSRGETTAFADSLATRSVQVGLVDRPLSPDQSADGNRRSTIPLSVEHDRTARRVVAGCTARERASDAYGGARGNNPPLGMSVVNAVERTLPEGSGSLLYGKSFNWSRALHSGLISPRRMRSVQCRSSAGRRRDVQATEYARPRAGLARRRSDR